MIKEPIFYVNNLYAPSLVPQGPDIGQQANVLRLAGCNLTCEWCDSPETWSYNKEIARKHRYNRVYIQNRYVSRVTLKEVATTLINATRLYGADILVITGGEPLLQRGMLNELFKIPQMEQYYKKVIIETAGTVAPFIAGNIDTHFIVSPKLSNSNVPKKTRYKPIELKKYLKLNSSFIFVVETVEDFPEIEELIRKCNIPRQKVWITYDSVTVFEHTNHNANLIAQKTVEKGFHYALRIDKIYNVQEDNY